jgi:sugar (pentulose or hexulose) kinase
MSLGHARDVVVVASPLARSFAPDTARGAALAPRLQRFRSAYAPLRALA